MVELLELLGFSQAEIAMQLPRVEKAFAKLGIEMADIQQAKKRVTTYYDVALTGVRKALRLCLLEFLDSVLAREEGKTIVLSGFMAPAFETIGSAIVGQSSQVCSTHQSWAFLVIVGCVLDKLAPILEAAEKKWLKAGMVAHCGNVKTLLGSVALELIPKPDLMVTAGFMCETAPKTLDLLHEVYGLPVACYDTCLDRDAHAYGSTTQRTLALAAQSLRSVVATIEQTVGFGISDELLLETIHARAKLADGLEKIQGLIATSDPLPLSATHGTLWMCLKSLTLTPERLGEAVQAVTLLHDELQARVRMGRGAAPKGAPRVLALLPQQHADPRLEHLAGEVGLAIVASDPDLHVPYGEPSRDPYVLMCMGLAHSLITSLPRRIPLIIEGCRRWKIDGVLDRYHIGCRSVVGDAFLIENAIKKELGLPVLVLEWENFDPRVFDEEQYRKRLEVFKAMMAKPMPN